MRRTRIAVAGALLAACACRLSVEGVALPPLALDAGADTSVAPPPPPPLADAGADVPVDARPPGRGDCALLTCIDAGSCASESCGTAGAGSWGAKVEANGTIDDTSTDCTSNADPSATSAAFKQTTVEGGARYQFELRFLFTTNATTKGAIAEISTGTTARVRLLVENQMLTVCSASGKCTPPRALPAPAEAVDVHVYGKMGIGERTGTAVLEIGRLDCIEVSSIELDGPFEGDGVTAKVGCVDAHPCYLYWDDARLSTRPY